MTSAVVDVDDCAKTAGAAHNSATCNIRLMLHPILSSCVTAAVMALAVAAPAAGTDVDVERALAAARVKASAGDVVAQFSLGAMIYYGEADTAQALDWFRRAAAKGYAPAEFQMGLVYDFGFVVAQDDREALTWYRKAADHGSAAAQRAVGDFYRKGRGVAADAAEAARWYRRGADGDDIRENELGQMSCPNRRGARLPVGVSLVCAAAGQAPLEATGKVCRLRNMPPRG